MAARLLSLSVNVIAPGRRAARPVIATRRRGPDRRFLLPPRSTPATLERLNPGSRYSRASERRPTSPLLHCCVDIVGKRFGGTGPWIHVERSETGKNVGRHPSSPRQ